ncbi:MAG TPA: undecaprenyldiphospho-muramoylpentapeptide beta-N-acetylglucosaminyltransferase [Bdellovibrionota bacterium]|nr:undecaprenyldiphospho-muramoylpentapeptide beta-N-acetylglucosaminyltransferase [Bdellovibrionota bacterium]
MKLLMAAGGTGGHVFPALAIARTAVAKNRETKVLFVGTPKGFESRSIPKEEFPLELISVGGLKGKRFSDRMRNMATLPAAFWASWKILRNFAPNVAFGIGGYASGPILLLAALRGLETAILEPNAVPGFSNRVLSRFVHRVFLAFEEAKSRLPERKCLVVGNPIRSEILRVAPPIFSGEKRTLLIFGGSQGAHRLNDAMIHALPFLETLKEKLFMIHQTGARDELAVRKAYRDRSFQAEVHPFIDGMSEAYGRADLVIGRSGSSVMEIAACGRPSILVPFPYAADDHQRMNGRIFAQAGAAIYIEDQDCSGETLAKAIRELVTNPNRLREMSVQALRFRHEDAADRIVQELTQMSGSRSEREAA